MSDFNKSSLSEIVNLIKSKKTSSLEVTNHFIKNIEKSSKLNSFVHAASNLGLSVPAFLAIAFCSAVKASNTFKFLR